jgi:hypothetical protein
LQAIIVNGQLRFAPSPELSVHANEIWLGTSPPAIEASVLFCDSSSSRPSCARRRPGLRAATLLGRHAQHAEVTGADSGNKCRRAGNPGQRIIQRIVRHRLEVSFPLDDDRTKSADGTERLAISHADALVVGR